MDVHAHLVGKHPAMSNTNVIAALVWKRPYLKITIEGPNIPKFCRIFLSFDDETSSFNGGARHPHHHQNAAGGFAASASARHSPHGHERERQQVTSPSIFR